MSSPPSKTIWIVALMPSLKPLTPEVARLTGKQKRPSPVVWKKGTAWVKLLKLEGFWAVETITPTGRVHVSSRSVMHDDVCFNLPVHFGCSLFNEMKPLVRGKVVRLLTELV